MENTVMLKPIKPALMMLLLFTLLTGVVYPLLVTVTAQALYPKQANGSLLGDANKLLGSELIGQSFTRAEYFWGRPSATAPNVYNAAASSGSNLGPSNPALPAAVAERIKILRAADPTNTHSIPVDLVTTSASGLDPHISPAAAEFQVARVAKARHLPAEDVRELVKHYTEARQWGVLGEARVNVLRLNLALEGRTEE
jgi:K+-transporting ATPase ATPase C chain